MVFDLLRKRKPSREEEQERRRVGEILDAALLQRSKIHVRFDENATSLTSISATILSMDDGLVELELDGLGGLTDNFIDQRIDCFFRIVERDARHREIFYNFATQIQAIRSTAASGPRVTVRMPQTIEGTQRRKSLRLRPDLQKFSHVAIWRYDASGNFDLAKPTLPHGQFKSGQAILDNLSAGGLRLTLRRTLLKEQGFEPRKGDRFLVFFSFAEQLPKQIDEYWLIGKINNLRPEPVSGDLTLGMEFIATGRRQLETGKISWEKVADNVINDLAQRIYQWHLTLYRDKGLT